MAVLKGIDFIRRWVIQTVLKDQGKLDEAINAYKNSISL